MNKPVWAERSSQMVLSLAALFLVIANGERVQAQCVGDCNGDTMVTVDELVRAVNIALGATDISQCNVVDANADGSVTVDELVRAVNNALTGCPPQATPTATSTSTASAVPTDTEPVPTHTVTATATATATEIPVDTATSTETPTAGPSDTPTEIPASATPTDSPADTATPTATPTGTDSPLPTSTPTLPSTSAGENVAGRAAVVTNGVNALANVISGVVVSASGATSLTISRAAVGGSLDVDNCPISGTTTQDCSAGSGMVNLMLGAQNCVANGPLGGTGTFNGSVSLVGPGFFCPLITGAATFGIDIQAVLNNGIVDVLVVDSELSGSATLGIGGTCLVASVQGTMNGTLSGTLANGTGTEITFNNTSFSYTNPTYNADCVPIVYSFTFNGAATIRELASNETFDVTFINFVMTQNAQTAPVTVTYSGGISSDCFGGAVALQTIAPIAVAAGQLCPTGGTIDAAQDGTARITYMSDGSVSIDNNSDGVIDESFPSCTDPALLMCGS